MGQVPPAQAVPEAAEVCPHSGQQAEEDARTEWQQLQARGLQALVDSTLDAVFTPGACARQSVTLMHTATGTAAAQQAVMATLGWSILEKSG